MWMSVDVIFGSARFGFGGLCLGTNTMKNEVFVSLSIQELQQLIQAAVAAGIIAAQGKEQPKSLNTGYLSRNDAAKMLGITPKSLSKYIKEGKISAKRLGSKYYILESDVEASLKSIDTIKYSKRNPNY